MAFVYVIGSAMTRFGKFPQSTVKDLAAAAVQSVLQDAALQAGDIQAAFVANSFWGMYTGQHSIRGQVMLRPLGIAGIPITNVENACAGASTAFHLAWTAVSAGLYDVVLALGVEKISHVDKSYSFRAYTSALDVENMAAHLQTMLEVSKGLNLPAPPEQGTPGEGRSIFMDLYATMARYHMNKYGVTQKQLAVIASKNHWHGSLNPLAQIQQNMTVEEVLQDRLIAYPLTRAMCSPVGDGAAAAILCSEKYLSKLAAARPVRVLASVLTSGRDRPIDGEDIGERTARLAYQMAGLGPTDISVAELHDATAFGELHQTEAMGFCAPGEGGILAESGATRLGGRIPVNTSGGLECRGHPIGASGLAQIHEIVTQLRGEAGARQVQNARIGLAENGGGNIGFEEAALCIHIFERVTHP